MRNFLAACYLPVAKIKKAISPGARILMYHRVADLPSYDQLTVSVKQFDEQITWLKSHYELVSLDQAINNPARNQVVITFDDGYLDNLEHALPILEKHQVPAIIYVTSEFADQQRSHPRYKTSERLHLNWQEIKQLSDHPLITIGSHTQSHPYLQRVNTEDCLSEIKQSKLDIEKQLNKSCEHFCYPSGDYAKREIDLVEKAGYTTAVTVSPGANKLPSNSPFALKRTEITDKDNARSLRLKLEGGFDLIHSLLDIKRKKQFSKLAYKG